MKGEIAGSVGSASIRHWCEVRCVGLQNDAINQGSRDNLANVFGITKRGDAIEAEHEAFRKTELGKLQRAREAVDYAFAWQMPAVVCQNVAGVAVGLSRMNYDGQGLIAGDGELLVKGFEL